METAQVEVLTRAASLPVIIQQAGGLDGFEEYKTNLDEGPAFLILPNNLSPESVDELDYWVQGVLRRMKRRARIPAGGSLDPSSAE